MSRPKQGKLVVTLPVECRPEFFTAFPLSNDLAQGGLFVYPDGEIRHWKPDDDVEVTPKRKYCCDKCHHFSHSACLACGVSDADCMATTRPERATPC